MLFGPRECRALWFAGHAHGRDKVHHALVLWELRRIRVVHHVVLRQLPHVASHLSKIEVARRNLFMGFVPVYLALVYV